MLFRVFVFTAWVGVRVRPASNDGQRNRIRRIATAKGLFQQTRRQSSPVRADLVPLGRDRSTVACVLISNSNGCSIGALGMNDSHAPIDGTSINCSESTPNIVLDQPAIDCKFGSTCSKDYVGRLQSLDRFTDDLDNASDGLPTRVRHALSFVCVEWS